MTDSRWRLHPRVALRPEPFGALAYHYDNRRLNFVRSPDLVDLLRVIDQYDSPQAAFEAAGLDMARWDAFEKALISLERSKFIEAVPNGESGRE